MYKGTYKGMHKGSLKLQIICGRYPVKSRLSSMPLQFQNFLAGNNYKILFPYNSRYSTIIYQINIIPNNGYHGGVT